MIPFPRDSHIVLVIIVLVIIIIVLFMIIIIFGHNYKLLGLLLFSHSLTPLCSEDASADLVGGVLVSLAQAHEASSQPGTEGEGAWYRGMEGAWHFLSALFS